MPFSYRSNHVRLFLPLTAITLLVTGCMMAGIRGSGNIISENREIRDVEEVKVCCGMKLLLTQGEHTSLTLEGDDNILPEIETLVTGNKLDVRFRTKLGIVSHRPSQRVIVHLQMKTIHGVEINGGGLLEAASVTTEGITLGLSGGSTGNIGNLQATSVDLKNSGGSKMTIDALTTDSLKIDLNGGSHMTVNAGTATTQQASLSGGSHYTARALQSSSANIEIGGGGDAKVWVTESLAVRASGGSHVEYSGNPTLDQRLSGGSGVRHVDR